MLPLDPSAKRGRQDLVNGSTAARERNPAAFHVVARRDPICEDWASITTAIRGSIGPTRRFQFMLRIAVIALAAAATPASAQVTAKDWPNRPVTMVVTFAAGTAGDIVGRILSGPLGEALGRTVIVDNVPGGGGITGSNRVAKAAPDGYQFLVGTVGTHAIAPTLYKNPPYDAVTDFTPVGL